mmetsp:Transcript_51786/g.119013  ORF Transcript_51786/g.119013 Transcript_51786/m.119013 type:complete len:260 (-) Transcript_51786:183-962(-)
MTSSASSRCRCKASSRLRTSRAASTPSGACCKSAPPARAWPGRSASASNGCRFPATAPPPRFRRQVQTTSRPRPGHALLRQSPLERRHSRRLLWRSVMCISVATWTRAAKDSSGLTSTRLWRRPLHRSLSSGHQSSRSRKRSQRPRAFGRISPVSSLAEQLQHRRRAGMVQHLLARQPRCPWKQPQAVPSSRVHHSEWVHLRSTRPCHHRRQLLCRRRAVRAPFGTLHSRARGTDTALLMRTCMRRRRGFYPQTKQFRF